MRGGKSRSGGQRRRSSSFLGMLTWALSMAVCFLLIMDLAHVHAKDCFRDAALLPPAGGGGRWPAMQAGKALRLTGGGVQEDSVECFDRDVATPEEQAVARNELAALDMGPADDESRPIMSCSQVARQLWLAAESGDEEGIVEAASAAQSLGIDISEAVHDSVNGGSPLHWAAKEGHVGAVRRLTVFGARVNAVNTAHQSPLHWAAAKNQQGVIPMLVGAGAEIDAKDEGGWTPLHMAAYRGMESAVMCLCEHGANVSAADFEGDTALHMSAYAGRTAVAKALLGSGADLYARNAAGKTAHDLAMEGGSNCDNLAAFLEEMDHFHHQARMRGHQDFSLRTYVGAATTPPLEFDASSASRLTDRGGGQLGATENEEAGMVVPPAPSPCMMDEEHVAGIHDTPPPATISNILEQTSCVQVSGAELGKQHGQRQGAAAMRGAAARCTRDLGVVSSHDSVTEEELEGPAEKPSSVWESADEYTEVSEGGTPLREAGMGGESKLQRQLQQGTARKSAYEILS